MKEKVSDKHCGDDAGQVGNETGCERIPRISDIHRSKIHGQDIERRFAATPKYGSKVSHETVRAEIIGMSHVQHHAACGGTAEGLKEGHGKRFDEVGVYAHEQEDTADPADDIVQRPRGSKYADSYQHGNEVGNDLDRRHEAFFGAFDERLE